MRTTLCSAHCRMVAPWPPEEGTSPATGYSLPFMGRGAPSPLQGYYDPRGSDQRETHIPLQSSPSRVGSQLSEGSSMHTMPPWHWILEGPPQGCLTFCSPPFPSAARYAHAGAVEAILGWIALVVGVVDARHSSGAFDDAGSAAG